MRGQSGVFKQFWRDERGAISILAGFLVVSVIGVSALALEYGHGLLQKVENQRAADLAAYGGALVYGATNSNDSATSAASNIAALNGMSSGVSTSVVSSPTGDGNNAVKVTVTTNVPLMLARVLTTNTTLPVSATSHAEIKSSAPGCIIALNGLGTGVTLAGAAQIAAPGCAVASNSTVIAHACANEIETAAVDYNGAVPGPTCAFQTAGGATPPMNKDAIADPLGAASGSPGSTEVINATARVSTVSSMSSPGAPSVPAGTSITFDSGGKKSTTASNLTTIGCSGSIGSSVWTVTCSGIGPCNFGAISISGGVSVTITNTSSGATYNFSGLIDSGTSDGLTFNGGSNATYKMAGGIVAHGTAPMTFSAGTFNIGTTSSSPCPAAGYSICISGSASITFAGPSSFTMAGGIYQGASGKPASLPVALTLGYGASSNSFNIGKSSDGYSLNEANGATLFGDATSAGDLFQTAGKITTSGGTCVAISAASEHDINGSLDGAGGIVLGAGVYTFNGYVALGNSGGGWVADCPTIGGKTGLTGLGVTLVVSGVTTVTCGSTASSFCLGAGYGSCDPSICVNLTAPTSGSTANLAVIGPQSISNSAGATFANGADNTRISGAFYFPNGAVTMSGAAALHDTVDAGACLELIGSQVTLSAGTATGTSCTGLGGCSLGTTVTLVQ